MRVLIKVIFDGGGFFGWQMQPDKRTIEGELTDAVEKINGFRTPVIGSGRTDAGVHALAQTAHFDLRDDFDVTKLSKALNFYLGEDIRVVGAKKVSADFHARKNVKQKTYIYKMYESDIEDPLKKNRELRIDSVDISLMKEASRLFIGTHDFRAFMSSGSSIKTTTRKIFGCVITKKGASIVLKITANGFLYNMVRKITASLILVGQNKKGLGDILASLSAPYPQVKELAPPYGLYLHSIKY